MNQEFKAVGLKEVSANPLNPRKNFKGLVATHMGIDLKGKAPGEILGTMGEDENDQ